MELRDYLILVVVAALLIGAVFVLSSFLKDVISLKQFRKRLQDSQMVLVNSDGVFRRGHIVEVHEDWVQVMYLNHKTVGVAKNLIFPIGYESH